MVALLCLVWTRPRGRVGTVRWKSVPLIIFCVALLLLRSAAYGLLATPSDEEGTVLLVDIQVSRAR